MIIDDVVETKLNPNLFVGDALLEALATGIPNKMVDARVVGDALGGFAETLLGVLLPTLLTRGPPAVADSDPPS